ncbi:hypothetical protein CFC21_100951 [Triticum aestivum]|uniref:R13L1/DRL21-like LRR repeat region domain-containing protein n=2 Tax=Triticum aestivum TaxID=4565 RepID=A0A3B6SCQ6_WHEAT|nr:hypothetical protein CFC21_100951 [Triticum aestivum]
MCSSLITQHSSVELEAVVEGRKKARTFPSPLESIALLQSPEYRSPPQRRLRSKSNPTFSSATIQSRSGTSCCTRKHNAQAQGSHVGDNPALQRLLDKLSRDADQAEDLLDELHYFQIHDKLHGTTYATTQDLDGLVRHQALHAGTALRHAGTALRHAGTAQEMCKLREKKDIIANLRTLMFFREYGDEGIAKILKDSFKEINSLRVLFIVVKSAESFPYRFSKLIHLQYLKISSSYSEDEMSLPSTLSRFYHLKILDLDLWRGSSDLPEDFSRLENLHDFHAASELHSNIRNVGKMKHLQELKEFHVRKESMGFELSELGALTELEGGLTICGLEHVATKEVATAAKLMLKRNLKELGLLWSRDGPTTDDDILDALQPHSNLRVLRIVNHGGTVGPSWLCLDIWLTSLETLTLDCISWNTLPPFGKLPNLKGLKLKKISGMHQFGPRCGGAAGKCFMRLKAVGFYEMAELAEWVVEPNCQSFPSLETIECIDCPNLCVMPLSEASFTNLRRLKVSGCPKMSLPSMPHTSTLTHLDVEKLSYHGKKLFVSGYGGALASHNLDKVEDMTVGRCDGLFPGELDGSFVFRSVKSLKLDVSHLTSRKSSSSKVLNCFPALSVLEIHGDEECVMQLPSSSSLQELTFSGCKGLVLVPVENGGGIQEDKSLLQSLTIYRCSELFCRWPMEESETICYFPASLMALLSNLTALTTLTLWLCSNLTVDGFNPLIAANLIQLQVGGCNTLAADMLSEVASQRAKLLLPAGYISRLEVLRVDDICGLFVAPICSRLAPALHTLEFWSDKRTESFTKEQEKALQLLTSLQTLEF